MSAIDVKEEEIVVVPENENRLVVKDIGLCNVGLCRGDPLKYMENPDGYTMKAERANHLVRLRDGRVFDYEQNEAHLRILEWHSEYGHWLRESELYLIEGQLSYDTGYELERGCLIYQTAEVSVMETLREYGIWKGVVGIVSPREWKRYFGIPPSPKHLSSTAKHEFQKKEDVKAYIKRFGIEAYNKLVKRWGVKVDDAIDATLLWVFGAENYRDLLKRFKYQSSHVWVHNNLKSCITAKDRLGYDIGKGLYVEEEDVKKFVLRPDELALVWNQANSVRDSRKRKR